MKPLLIFLLSIFTLSGCVTTSQTTKDIAATVIDTAETLQTRHIETIDAYIKSMEAAKADTNTLLKAIEKDKNKLAKLKKEIISIRAEAMVGKAIIEYEDKVQKDIFNKLDQKIEDIFWPPIVAKQKTFQDKADELKQAIANHPCTTSTDGCTNIPLTNYRNLLKQYRDYSVAAEYILHLGYEQETLIWQKAVENYEQQRESVKTKAFEFLAKQSNNLNISSNALKAELEKINEQFETTITQLKEEKSEVQKNWTATQSALELLEKEITKPAVWELVLNGASKQAKSILISYSDTVKNTVSGVFGNTAGQLASKLYENKMIEIADKGTEKLNGSISKLFDKAIDSIDEKVDTFNTENSKKE